MDGPCKNHISLVNEHYFVQETDEPMMMGVGGTAYKTYELSKDAQKGECIIPFILNQPWDQAPPGWQNHADTMIKLQVA